MKKTLHFSNGIKSADIDVTLNNGRLSISGTVYHGKKLLKSEKNLISAGQCLEKSAELIPQKLANIWKRWHLNDLRAGTPAQEKALEPVKDTFSRSNWYDEACRYLASINLYDDNGYRYGSAWLREELPEDVVEYVQNL